MGTSLDYGKLLTDRVILITGAGRSGTTILGKIIGSMSDCYYLFEPSIMKFVTNPHELRATIFEDYWLLQYQGRAGNYQNFDDDSHMYNYRTDLCRMLGRKDDVKNCLNSKLVIKLTEFQNRTDFFKLTFPGAKVVHIYRNGNDVVDSMMKRGWYTDKYMKIGFLDQTLYPSFDIPSFLDLQSVKKWSEYNQVTRCACVWRCSVDELREGNNMLQIRYEDLPSMEFDGLASWLNLGITDLTRKHIKSVQNRELTQHKNTIDDIQGPERNLFLSTMKRLKYV